MVSQPPDEQDLNSDQLDEHFEDMEEMDEVHHKLKIPKDLEGHGGDRFDMANDEEDDDEEEKTLKMTSLHKREKIRNSNMQTKKCLTKLRKLKTR
jgi:hypothetical protein